MLRCLKSRLKPLLAGCGRFARTASISSTRDAIRLHTSLRHVMEPVQIDCRLLGRKVWLRPGTSDLEVFHGIFADKDYEFACWDISPELIVDAGANIGLTSLYFARKHPTARIIAIEPEASNLELLRRNTQSEPNITVIAGALWPHKTLLSMQDETAEKWAFSVSEARADAPGIEAYTIPDILAGVGAQRIDLLKIDIEGAEKELFSSGWEEWLPRVGRIAIELHDRLVPGCSMAFYRAVLTREFRQMSAGGNLAVDFNTSGGSASG
jgi:FkbM family methyltransferase